MPPDPAPRPDAGRHLGVPAGIPEPPKKTREINWTAVGSVAAVVAALIAFLAYALPSGGSTPDPVLAGDSPTSSSPSTALPTQATSAPASATVSATSPSSIPSLAQPGGPPAGCQQAEAAIGTFNETVGSSWYSRQDAAGQAANGIFEAFQSGVSNTIASDLSALDNDFTNLHNVAMAQADDAWDTIAAQTDQDIQVLNTACDAG